MLSARLASRAPLRARAHVDQRGMNAKPVRGSLAKIHFPVHDEEGNEVRRSGPRARNIDQARNQAFRDTRGV